MTIRTAGLMVLAGTLAGCGGTGSTGGATAAGKITRYDPANRCMAIASAESGLYLNRAASGYAAAASALDDAEGFYLKPAALGQYLLFDTQSRLAAAAATVDTLTLDAAEDRAIWTLLGVGDGTDYPPAPTADVDPDPAVVQAYRDFDDPLLAFDRFELHAADGTLGAVAADGQFVTRADAASATTAFTLTPLPTERCSEFPEISTDTSGETFKGTRPDGRVLGYADSHLHLTSTSFLGGAKPGAPFDRFGVSHALADCSDAHGQSGERDVVGALFTGDTDGHDTRGWPEFPDWPAWNTTTHEATYWRWIERAWKAGLRLTVNLAVDNETLCELQRNVSGDALRNCNEMTNAGRQLATAWALQDYIDAQYGGPGRGWFRIVTDPASARSAIADGKLAVLLGVEVSNLFNCSVTYNPASTQEAFEETGDPASGGQTYGCATTETGADNEVLTQMLRLRTLGVSSLFTVHEFDNAIGGNDIFDGAVLNLGSKENTGGLNATDTQAAALAGAVGAEYFTTNGAGTGEYWSTFSCPDAEASGGGYIFGQVGAVMTNFGPPPPLCANTGQGGRPGGATTCYPAAPQCNARLLTPLGLYVYQKMMELGFVFEIDHLALLLKDQLLDLAEAQDPAYPTVSAHGWSGLTFEQARRIFADGGLVYPSIDNTQRYADLWASIKTRWAEAGRPFEFGFGYGSDTNGLSPQAVPRNDIEPGHEVVYPYTLFRGDVFDDLPQFDGVDGVTFLQPEAHAPDGRGRTWDIETDGNAHYGMASGLVEEMRQDGRAELLSDFYNSAETYLQFWERTLAARNGIARHGFKVPEQLLRAAPVDP